MRTVIGWLVLVTLAGCAPVDEPRPAAQRTTTREGDPAPEGDAQEDIAAGDRCADEDGDGYGEGCVAGADCDDGDPSVRDECVRCARPAEGCACAASDRPAACDVDTNGAVTAATCWVGQRACAEGRWGRCTAYGGRFR